MMSINKKKLILVECEMKGPKGHFLNNLIESTYTFRKLDIYWILNKDFNCENSYLPNNVKIIKCIDSNIFKRKENKFFYFIEEFFFFIKNIFYIFFYLFFFFKHNNFNNYIRALKSNYFIIPKYFRSFYNQYIKLKLEKNDHIFFQTARRKDMALINFLIKLDSNHPKFHIRVMMPPKIKFKGFFYYMNEINDSLRDGRVYIYLWSEQNYKYFIKNSLSKKGIFRSNIPWSFYKRKYKKKNHVVGYIGDARISRGFHFLPKLIDLLEKKKSSLKFLIHFSKITQDLKQIKNELHQRSKYNKKIKIIEGYCDYKRFNNYLKKIDIMPILHYSKEINSVTSGTMYSCIPYEIPFVIPVKTFFMRNILKYKCFEKAKNLNDYANKIILISKKYNYYLKNIKLCSNKLKKVLENDPLKNNILT